MIAGIGIDIVDLAHMASVCEKTPKISKRILTAPELEIYETLSDKRKTEFLAGRFAAKEAFSKAMGTGIGKTVTFQSLTIVPNEKGQPVVEESPFDGNVFISISHSQEMVVAQIVLETAE